MNEFHHHHPSCRSTGQPEDLSLFPSVAVRQMGIPPDHGSAPALATAAEAYLRGDKSASDCSRHRLFLLVSSACALVTAEEIKELGQALVGELDACMLAYFGFHWHHAETLLDQVGGIQGRRKRSIRMHVCMCIRRRIEGLIYTRLYVCICIPTYASIQQSLCTCTAVLHTALASVCLYALETARARPSQ